MRQSITKPVESYPDLWGLIGLAGLILVAVLAGLTIWLMVLPVTV